MPTSSLSVDVGVWPDGVIDWDLDGTADAVSTASEFSEGQVGLVLGAELGVDTRAGLPGQPTGIARPIEPRAGATTAVRPAIFQGW